MAHGGMQHAFSGKMTPQMHKNLDKIQKTIDKKAKEARKRMGK